MDRTGRSGRCLAVLMAVVFAKAALAAPPAGYQLSFSDEFNGTAIDQTVWRVLDSRPNVSVGGGVADFTTVEISPGVYQEGWIDTRLFRQRYGFYEARFRIGNKSGLNNAFWLNTPTEWADADNTHDRLEIDINEAHFPDPVSRDFTCGIHSWETGAKQSHGGTGIDVGDLSTGFNLFQLEWRTDNSLVFSLNGTARYTLAATDFEEANNTIPVEVLFSTKVLTGGFAGTIDPNVGGTKMSVDYVRVYDEPGFIGATSGNWGTGTNWGDGDWERAGEAALFNRATPNTTITVAGADKQAREILFDNASVPALTFVPRADFPSAILRLGLNRTAGITINEDVVNSQTFSIPIVAEGNLTLSNFASAAGVELNINNAVSGVGVDRQLTVFTTNTVNVSGAIASSIAAVQKFQTGTARLAGANEYTGQTLIKQGTLTIASPTALGAATAGTIVSSGATLGLSGGFTYARAEGLRIIGVGVAPRTGAIELLDASTVSIEAMPIVLDGSATVSTPQAGGRVRLGSVTIGAGQTLTFTGAGTTEVNGAIGGGGRFVSTGTGKVSIGSASVIAGQVRVVNGGTLEIRSDAIHFQSDFDMTGSKLDLLDNGLVLNKSSDNALPDIRGEVRNGFDGGTWRGNGIVTSLSGTGGLVIGFADNAVLGLSSFLGIAVNSDSLLLRAVRTGDTNLDGVVNMVDLVAMGANYNMSSKTWTDGDMNYDLTVNYPDLFLLTRNFQGPVDFGALQSFSATFRADVTRATAVIPEPGAVAMLLPGLLVLGRRGRR
jgi:autotransporter-associated beta strand protein